MIKIEWKSCLKVALTLFLLYLSIHYWAPVSGFFFSLLRAARPLFVGFVIAFIINVLMTFYENHYFPNSKKKGVQKSRRAVCLALSYLTLGTVFSLIIWLVIPQLISCISLIFERLPSLMEVLMESVRKWSFLPEDWISYLNTIDWVTYFGQAFELFGEGVGSAVSFVVDVVTSVFSGIVSAFISLVFSGYLLLGKDRYKRQGLKLLDRVANAKWKHRVFYVCSISYHSFRRYLVGQTIEALILGTLCALGMLVLGLPYAAMIGALVAVTAYIPVVGAFIGGGIGALMIFADSPIKALVFIIFLVILQQLENNLIYPRVVGSSMGLPSIWVLAAITVGGGVFGVLGMLLAVPIAATLYGLLRNEFNGTTPQGPPDAQTAEKETPEGINS